MEKLETYCPNTWCPGCGNFGILQAVKDAVNSLIESGTPKEKIILVADIGCNSKIVDYLGLNSFYGLHGRSIAAAEGILQTALGGHAQIFGDADEIGLESFLIACPDVRVACSEQDAGCIVGEGHPVEHFCIPLLAMVEEP